MTFLSTTGTVRGTMKSGAGTSLDVNVVCWRRPFPAVAEVIRMPEDILFSFISVSSVMLLTCDFSLTLWGCWCSNLWCSSLHPFWPNFLGRICQNNLLPDIGNTVESVLQYSILQKYSSLKMSDISKYHVLLHIPDREVFSRSDCPCFSHTICASAESVIYCDSQKGDIIIF